MLELLQALQPISAAELADHIACLRRCDPESVQDLPPVNQVPAYLRALQREGKAEQIASGEWTTIPQPVIAIKRELQKGLFGE